MKKEIIFLEIILNGIAENINRKIKLAILNRKIEKIIGLLKDMNGKIKETILNK